jgi:hypothetical protein
LPLVVAVGAPFAIALFACGGGTPDPKVASTDPTDTSTTTATATAPTTTASASASDDADDGNEDDTIPTADILCKHLADVLKGKAGALAACVKDMEKKQVDDENYFVCYAPCAMSASSPADDDACKTKCKK